MRPALLEIKYGQHIYNIVEFEDFFKNGSVKYVDFDIKGKILHIQAKTISQNKLREAGFSITREPIKADAIVISDFIKEVSYYSYGGKGTTSIAVSFDIESFFDEFDDANIYIIDKELYKYLYKYDGNQELFYSCKELLASNISDNLKIAMEFISNANWTNNEIYLQEIFSLYWFNHMRRNPYRSSISFKGFLNSLDFNYENLSMHEASSYRALCKNEEHHDWVYKKYEEQFKIQLDELVSSFKIKLDKIEYSIDRNSVL